MAEDPLGSAIEASEGAFEFGLAPDDLTMVVHDEVQRQIMVICKICGECTPESDLQSHMLKGHFKRDSLRKSCSICNVKVEDWHTHNLTYHGGQRDTIIQKPLKGKAGEKIKCDFCHKFLSIDNMSSHTREQHEGRRKPCPRCFKEFSPSNLLRHIKQVHENETATCQYCNKVLTPCNLNKHIKAVHMKLREKCEICGVEMAFSALYQHRKGVHRVPSSRKRVTPEDFRRQIDFQIRNEGSENKRFVVEREDEASMQRLVSQTFETVNINGRTFTFS